MRNNDDPALDADDLHISDIDGRRRGLFASSSKHPRLHQSAGMSRTWVQRVVLPAVLVLSVLALLILPPGFPLHQPVSSLAQQILSAAPTATSNLAPSARQLYLDADVPGTAVFVDGHHITVPVIGHEAPMMLTPGVHHLKWRVTPFQPKTCQVSIPASRSDTCPLPASTASFSGGPPAPVVELSESLDTLPARQQTALLQATQAALDNLPSTVVQPGESFMTSADSAGFPTTFRARLTFQLQSRAGIGCSLGAFSSGGDGLCQLTTGQDCARFCSLPWPSQQVVRAASGTAEWLVLAVASLSWTYRRLDGTLIASNQPLDFFNSGGNHLVMLSVSWDAAGWHVTPILGEQLGGLLLAADGTPVADDPACAPAQDMLGSLGGPGGAISLTASTNPSAGCLVTVEPAVYLVRLGYPIPANSSARALGTPLPPRLAPNLTPDDTHLVTELQALPGQVVGTAF
jgi:hypothetical protein